METTRSRLQKVLRGELPEDRLPVVEWATWWDLTLDRWHGEGLPRNLDYPGIKRYFGLDVDYQHWFWPIRSSAASPYGPDRWIEDEADYDRLRPHLFPDPPYLDRDLWARRAEEHRRGECAIWITFHGFFWGPRVLFGIEEHMMAFYDQPKLMHRINEDFAAYHIRCLEAIDDLMTPDFMTFAEDMSYNHGPMLGKGLFDEFLAPYYRQVVPELERRGIVPLIDSDGQVEMMVPWLEACGLRGILPLERRAGVDIARLREAHPDFRLIGAFDKTTLCQGEAAMREEFERLLPVMRRGGFLPSVDHQTPPDVDIETYRLYVSLLKEVAARAVGIS